MVKKKIDNRIRVLIENNIKNNHRSFFVVVGDKGKDQVMHLHYILTKATTKTQPTILWCYKSDLGFVSDNSKRKAQFEKRKRRNPDAQEDPFSIFLASTIIRYTYYSETQKILGNTFGMLILQDFEAITPNLLARTIETIEGGGLVILLLKTINSLRQLYTLTMDVHARFRSGVDRDVVGRFNERFILSLASCHSCLVMDDELNILPISSHSRNIAPLPTDDSGKIETPEQTELKNLKHSLRDTEIVGDLIKTAKTLDQAKVILTFIEAISEKALRSTVTLTAARGRGKSAALGVAIAGAVAFGYSNIFVTSPSPENLLTLFDFIFKGFDAIDLQEHVDYDLVRSTNPQFNQAIVRVNIFKTHRQTIQYIQPQDWQKLGQAELLVIDEAAAIPLTFVKQMLGPYLIFLSSTVNGYEGTGRSLSLKLIKQLREQSVSSNTTTITSSSSDSGRLLRELQLNEPIRYSSGDQIEKWLNSLLCLDVASVTALPTGCPHPNSCQLYYVHRDTLFSFHKASETFLQRMMALYVSSHYKNSPNDLQLMSDAPSQHLFVLLGPLDTTQNSLPEILCVLQVSLEGAIAKESILSGLSRGKRPDGDLIPWTMSQQFNDSDFPALSGGRVIRIATHPDHQRMGYGSRALELLKLYYEGYASSISEYDDNKIQYRAERELQKNVDEDILLSEQIKPRKNLPPLLAQLHERKPEELHWLGVCYGVTMPLFNFWSKAGYLPVYLRLTINEITGEHSCIQLLELQQSASRQTIAKPGWIDFLTKDFQRRFTYLLGYEFRDFSVSMALSILMSKRAREIDTDVDLELTEAEIKLIDRREFDLYFTPQDIERLDAYSRNIVDYHVITDLLPPLARLYFLGKTGNLRLSTAQNAILLGVGLQHKIIDDIVKELGLQPNQVLSLFNKSIKKYTQLLRAVQQSIAAEKVVLPSQGIDIFLDEYKRENENENGNEDENGNGNEDGDENGDENDEDEDEDEDEENEENRNDALKKLLPGIDLSEYKIEGDDKEWNTALKGGVKGSVSIRSKHPKKVWDGKHKRKGEGKKFGGPKKFKSKK